MKKILLIFVVTVLSLGTYAQMLTDFDGTQNITLEGWPNFPTIVANPSATGINTSANCAQFQRSTETWANVYSNLSAPLDFSTNNTIKVKVFCPYVCELVFKLEDQSGANGPVEILDTCHIANEWYQMEFNFSGLAPSGIYDKFTFFMDFATQNDTIFYVDDIEQVAGAAMLPIDIPLDFEASNVMYSFIGFGNAHPELSAGPVDASNTVCKVTKNVGAETWAGVTVGTEAGFANPIPFSAADTKMKFDVYSPAAGIPVLFKIEVNTNTAIFVEVQQLTTVANAWETLEFDFATSTPALDLANPYNKAVLFFDFGNVGAGDIFYWDNMEFISTGLAVVDLPITFESVYVDYTMIDFGGTSTVVDVDPVNGVNTCAVTTKNAGAETWAGVVTCTDDGMANPIPFTTINTKLSLKVYSPAAGIPIILKVEDHLDAAINVETTMETTVANAWETLVFDFTNNNAGTPVLDLANTYDKPVIFFDFGTNGGGEVYYWDDLEFFPTPLSQIDLPVTFEDPLVNYDMETWGGMSATIGEDPVDPSNTVGMSTKNMGAETWAGNAVGTGAGFATAMPFSPTETKMHLSVYSPAVGTPILMKVEDSNDGGHSCETLMETTVANAWEVIEFDFAFEAAGTPPLDFSWTYNKAGLFFNFGNVGDSTVYYWDDVYFGGVESVNSILLSSINIYPNPASDMINIEGAQDAKSIKIYNTLGELVLIQDLNNSNINSVNINSLTEGIYIISILNQNNTITSRRIVKQ